MLKAFALLFTGAMAFGADLAGIWTGHMVDRNGDLQDFSFRFEQNEGVLSGKMYGDNESIPITDGKVSGDNISFLVTTELNGSITKTLYTGTWKDGEIKVVRARVDTKVDKPEDSKKPDEVKKLEDSKKIAKPNPKQAFVLKRL